MKIKTYGNIANFDNDKKNIRLFLEVNTQRVRYTFYNTTTNEFVYLSDIQLDDSDNIEQVISNEAFQNEIGNGNFNSTICSFCSYRAMLVPQTLFDEDNLQSFLKFHHRFDEKDEIHYFSLPKFEAFIIYSISSDIFSKVKENLQHVKFLHHSIPFFINAAEKNILNPFPTIFIFIGFDFFDVTIIKQGKIQLFNSFYYKNSTDIVYFLSNLVNLFQLLLSIRGYISLQLNRILPKLRMNFPKFSQTFISIIFRKRLKLSLTYLNYLNMSL